MWPLKGRLPTDVNLAVTERCQARCTMCNIWRRRESADLRAETARRLFSDRLYSRVRRLGLGGGEPILHPDLPGLLEAVLGVLTGLEAVGLSTNGLLPERTRSTCRRLAQLCSRAGAAFQVAVSLDGLGEVHDRVRGVPRAFERASRSIAALQAAAKQLGFQVSVTATITRRNLGDLEPLREWCRARALPLRFRVASVIERLDNAGCEEAILLCDAERECVAAFLGDLAGDSQLDRDETRYYGGIAAMLRDGSRRRSGCLFPDRGVMVDARGDLYHCSVGGGRLGNGVKESSYRLFFSRGGRHGRNRLKSAVCLWCWHDYPLRRRD
ncbi:MAG: radical SAM protein [Armatimonadetes bacterium]|nr:radical SAM protein [Armatimonadota bacterium]NIM24829.1 radical SAM protein [Armatimonadota bacterium]NIM68719.1 radical SAM protein [Armatimonadota bacterium]NIM76012.1 radical SAM protein [Armatimonadota bacterium]NIN06916.1 radical SAM protein [Armatimonadota bacterium]